MGRFRFALQPALDVAVAREREAAVAAGRARAVVEQARSAIAALDGRGTELARLRGELASAAASSAQWIATEFFFERMREVRGRRQRALASADARARAAGESYVRAQGGRLALDNLRERRLDDYRAAEALREAAELDESNALGRKDR